MRKLIIAGAMSLAGFSAAAEAGVQIQTKTYNAAGVVKPITAFGPFDAVGAGGSSAPGSADELLVFDKFDPTKGTLLSATIEFFFRDYTLTGDIFGETGAIIEGGDAVGEALGAAGVASSFTASSSAFEGPGFIPLVPAPLPGAFDLDVVCLGEDDGTGAVGTCSGTTSADLSLGVNLGVFALGPLFALKFDEVSSADVMVLMSPDILNVLTDVTSAWAYEFGAGLTAVVDVTVVYEYAPIPVPGAAVLIVPVLLAGAGFFRRRGQIAR